MSTTASATDLPEPRALVRQIARRLRRRLTRVPPGLARAVSTEVDDHCRQLLSGGLEPDVAAQLIAQLADDLTQGASADLPAGTP